jgi:hypothetical protein
MHGALLSTDAGDEPIDTYSDKSESSHGEPDNTQEEAHGTFFSFSYPRASKAANFTLSPTINRAKEQVSAK